MLDVVRPLVVSRRRCQAHQENEEPHRFARRSSATPRSPPVSARFVVLELSSRVECRRMARRRISARSCRRGIHRLWRSHALLHTAEQGSGYFIHGGDGVRKQLGSARQCFRSSQYDALVLFCMENVKLTWIARTVTSYAPSTRGFHFGEWSDRQALMNFAGVASWSMRIQPIPRTHQVVRSFGFTMRSMRTPMDATIWVARPSTKEEENICRTSRRSQKTSMIPAH